MKIGYCVGVFDLLHYGHKNILTYARNHSDKLIVGIHTDKFVIGYKRKPNDKEEIRKKNVANFLKCDPSTVILIDDNHIDLIKKYNINTIYHGNDWEEEGYKKQIRYYQDGMDKLGIKLELIPYTRGISTSNIIAKKVTSLKDKKCFLFDLDNTLVVHKEPKIFSQDIIANLAKYNKDYYIVTNNNRYSPNSIWKMLKKNNLVFKEECILSSLKLIGEYIQDKFKDVFIWGTNEAIKYLTNLGVNQVKVKPEIVIVLYRNDYRYQELVHLSGLIVNTPYIIGNIDPRYPDKNHILPDTGSTLQLIKYVCDREPFIEFGKPNPIMLEPILKKYERKDIIFIGDSLLTDKKLCINCGIDFIHVHEEGDITNLGVLCDYLN